MKWLLGNYSQAKGVSSDGSIIVGYSTLFTGEEAFRWENNIISGIGGLDIDPCEIYSCATAVSSDGSVIVGYSDVEEPNLYGFGAFRWENGVMTNLGDLDGIPESQDCYATAVSVDGSVVVGYSIAQYDYEAFRWEDDVMQGIGTLIEPNIGGYSIATDVSEDGNVIVGYANTASGEEAFRWEDGNMVSLGKCDSFETKATGVSADGSIVIGINTGGESFIWDRINGMRDLRTFLTNNCCLDFSGWTILSAEAISADGYTIVGWGYGPSGAGQAWVISYSQSCLYPPKYSGGSGESDDPYLIATPEDLNSIGLDINDLDKHFRLTTDIDLNGKIYSRVIIAPSKLSPFTGTVDGAGFSVLNYKFDSGSFNNAGLFGYIKNAVIKNLGVENVDITNAGIAGAICLSNHGGTIENCFSTGNINGFFDGGGLCAWIHTEYMGEYPIGMPKPPVNTPVIENCYSTVNVTIVHPTAVPEFCTDGAGGLCAYAEGAELVNNYACGSVDARGIDTPWGDDIIIDNGGLIGYIKDCDVYNNYCSGHVVDGRAYSNPGGFCGEISGSQTHSMGNFWDIETSIQSNGVGSGSSDGITGKTTLQMQTRSTFANEGWDFVWEDDNGTKDIWRMCTDVSDYPSLYWEYPPPDFACPDGVDFIDFAILAKQWMLKELSYDIAPYNGNGIVNFFDWAEFANNWNGETQQLSEFISQWLMSGMYNADIAPDGGDDIVNWQDLMLLCENWLAE